MASLEAQELEKLTESDKNDLRKFLATEQQKTQIQSRKLSRSLPCRGQNVTRTSRSTDTWCHYNRNPLVDRPVLEEVRDRIDQELEVGQKRGGMLDELCGPVFGFEQLDI